MNNFLPDRWLFALGMLGVIDSCFRRNDDCRENKLARAGEIGLGANLYQYSENQEQKALQTIEKLNADPDVAGIIIQFPVYESWNFEELSQKVNSSKDVDGFKPDTPFVPATAAAVWEMLSEFGRLEGFSNAEEFLKGKIITVLGRGKTAGKPTRELLMQKGFEVNLIHSQTENPDAIIRSSDVIISATGKKHIINSNNLKPGAYVIGVGVGKENDKTFGDLDEAEIAEIAKLYCPTIGGIGPLTIACLIRNVVESAKVIR